MRRGSAREPVPNPHLLRDRGLNRRLDIGPAERGRPGDAVPFGR